MVPLLKCYLLLNLIIGKTKILKQIWKILHMKKFPNTGRVSMHYQLQNWMQIPFAGGLTKAWNHINPSSKIDTPKKQQNPYIYIYTFFGWKFNFQIILNFLVLSQSVKLSMKLKIKPHRNNSCISIQFLHLLRGSASWIDWLAGDQSVCLGPAGVGEVESR